MPENRFQEIVSDYVSYKLRQNEVFLEGFGEPSNPSQAALYLRRVADELIEANRQLFDSMCDRLNLTQTTTYSTFVGIADEMFQSGQNWGRIVAFLAFGATLVVYCAQREDLASLVNNIVGWLSRYMEQNLGNWIDENGGLDGFVEFFRRDNDAVSGWRMAAVAGLSLGALLMLACR